MFPSHDRWGNVHIGVTTVFEDAEQAKLNDFMSALGKVIDLGNQHGIEADYLNPLVASMKKLSENIITDQRAA